MYLLCAYFIFIFTEVIQIIMTKRLLAMLFCIAMIVSAFTGCSSYDPDEDVGETINLSLSEELYEFDPMYAYRSTEAAQMAKLMYATLFTVNEKGKLEKDLVKKYEIVNDSDKEIYRIDIELRDTCWSDGNKVSASDILYAWKRILNPKTVSDAAVLLYDIKNAYDAKNGDCSVDDIGVNAINTTTLQISFDEPIDFEAFLYNLASPCLAPVRETVVANNPDWSKKVATTVCSGPFTLREVAYGKSLTLERNSYYKRNRDKDSIKKAVTPYRLVFEFTKSEADQLKAFENGDIAYIANIPTSNRADYEKKAETANALSTLSCYINTNNELLADANVRKALSLAVDRTAIAEKLVFAKAATALVPSGVFEGSKYSKKDFRSVGGDYLSATANTDEAKKLANGGSFSITIQDNEADEAVAEMLKTVWESIGFKVDIVKLSHIDNDDILKGETEPSKDYYDDAYLETLQNGDFDVMLVDVSATAPSAFSVLAPYAAGYSCRDMKFEVDSYEEAVNVTGYESEEYNKLIDAAYAEKKTSARNKILHDAEKLIMEDLPVIPLVFTENAYVSDGLGKLTTDFFGCTSFTKTTVK